MSAPAGFLGVVLAGGASRRFGRDKAEEPVGGITLVDRAARSLSEVFSAVVVVGGVEPGQVASWPRIPDLRLGLGPLAGIEAALAHAETTGSAGVFALACDLPLVTPVVIGAVVAALGEGPMAAPRKESEPGLEPLVAIYRCSCLPVVRALLDGGDLRAHRIFAATGGTLVDVPAEAFLNVNTLADRERAEAALGGAGP